MAAPGQNGVANALAIPPPTQGTGAGAAQPDSEAGAESNVGVKAKGKTDPSALPPTALIAAGGVNAFAGALNPAAGAGARDISAQNASKADAGSGQLAGTPESGVAGGGSVSRSDTNKTPELQSVTNARLMQSLSRSEMQINVHSEDFGRVSIHTAYGREVISAQISLENSQLGSALGSALSAHVPAMEQKLGQDHGLRASVTIDTQTRGESGNNKDRQPNSQSERRQGSGATLASSVSAASQPQQTATGASSRSSTAERSRLDIRI